MPDVISIGLGGGSYVRRLEKTPAGCSIGPDSFGNQLSERALAKRGDVATASDVAVCLGRMDFGSKDLADAMGPDIAACAWAKMQRMLEDCIDHAKAVSGDVDVVVVGGGAALAADRLTGASRILRPKHADVANAIGAAIPQVSGAVDGVFVMGSGGEARHRVLADAEQAAKSKAVAAGADPATCEVVVREEVPLAYLPGGITRVRIKVIGDLQQEEGLATQRGNSGPSSSSGKSMGLVTGISPPTSVAEQQKQPTDPDNSNKQGLAEQHATFDWATWQPQVNAAGEWVLQRHEVDAIALGCAVLGAGGGGSAHRKRLKLLREMDRGRAVRVISPAAVPATGLVVDGSGMGAPTVGLEKISGFEEEAAIAAAVAAYRTPPQAPLPPQSASEAAATGQPEAGPEVAEATSDDGIASSAGVVAVMSGEVGGGNGVGGLLLGARMGLPVIDGDLMGRAFPELQMVTSAIYGLPLTPAALADEKGNVVSVAQAASPQWLEALLRPLCTAMGCSAGLATRPLTGNELRSVVIPHTTSLAFHIGRALLKARQQHEDPVAAVLAVAGGEVLFHGKVVDVQRSTAEGFARGSITLAEVWPDHSGQQLHISFQNENLIAWRRTDTVHGGEGAAVPWQDAEVVATVPDLTCCLNTDDGEAVATEDLRYGLRLSVISICAHPLLCTAAGLAVVGPKAFGYGLDYQPHVGAYRSPDPVMG